MRTGSPVFPVPTKIPARHNAFSSDKANRPALLYACAPVFALAAFGMVSVVQRQAEARASSTRYGHFTRQEARSAVKARLAPLLGVPLETLTTGDTFTLTGVLLRNEERALPNGAQSWQVLVRAPNAQYMVRLNADTGKVYAFNRLYPEAEETEGLEIPDAVTLGAPDGTSGEKASLLPWSEGLLRARQCLRRLGIPPNVLTPVKARATSVTSLTTPAPSWNFAYSRQVPGLGRRTVTVCINRRTGAPETFWDPTGAFMAL